MFETKKVAVLIPFYKDTLSGHENIALVQCFKILANYPIIAIKPESLSLPAGSTEYPFADTITFGNEYFKDIAGYNRLMLSEAFYKKFLDYEYILIYQLDAFIFKDELTYWCKQNWDYIGAPWIKAHPYPDIFKAIKTKIKNYTDTRYNVYEGGVPSDNQFSYKVGNGGFSLRRTRKFYEICLSHRDMIEQYNGKNSHFFNEDVFWSIEVNRKKKILKIPGYKKALTFAFEFFPHRALTINNNQLPFGCHAWDLNIDFWKPIFKELGYEI